MCRFSQIFTIVSLFTNMQNFTIVSLFTNMQTFTNVPLFTNMSIFQKCALCIVPNMQDFVRASTHSETQPVQ